MNSITDVDTLMAVLYPHVRQSRVGGVVDAPPSLQTNKSDITIHGLVDSFAELFSHYPHCEAAAVAIQTLHGETSLYVCPSPLAPDGFEANVKDCIAQFMTVRMTSGDVSQSESGQHFIMDAYRQCYPAMRQRAIVNKVIWKRFIKLHEPEDGDKRKLRDTVSGTLSLLSKLVNRLLDIDSRHTADLGDDTLQFHSICLEICNTMKREDLESYINKYLYVQGVDTFIARYLSLPIAISNLLSLPIGSDLPLNSTTVEVMSSQETRKFRAIIAADYLQNCFGGGIDWRKVEDAFIEEEDFGRGLTWDTDEHILSSRGCVAPHPEVTLIDLLSKNDVFGHDCEVYIACSPVACYASVMYAGVVNNVLKEKERPLKFTMRTDDEDWCRLSTVEPWILPENTTKEVIEGLKKELFRHLDSLMEAWEFDNREIGTC